MLNSSQLFSPRNLAGNLNELSLRISVTYLTRNFSHFAECFIAVNWVLCSDAKRPSQEAFRVEFMPSPQFNSRLTLKHQTLIVFDTICISYYVLELLLLLTYPS